ncbi:hypothetical protein D3C77_378220 [compost metagenome]
MISQPAPYEFTDRSLLVRLQEYLGIARVAVLQVVLQVQKPIDNQTPELTVCGGRAFQILMEFDDLFRLPGWCLRVSDGFLLRIERAPRSEALSGVRLCNFLKGQE